MKISSLLILLTLSAIGLTGCASQLGTGSSDIVGVAEAPTCNYGLEKSYGDPASYVVSNTFYLETNRETSVGKPIKDGTILFYGKFNEVNKLASTAKPIYNKDVSPLTPNWVWKPDVERQVVGMFSTDNKSWWYLIETGMPLSYAYWTSAPNGMLCNNVVGIHRGALTTRFGMSRIYQDSPVVFTDKPKAGRQPLSISLSVIKVNGATAEVEINAMSNGRAVFTERTNVDLMGGEFSASGVTFSTRRKGDQTYLVSVKVPDNVSAWIGSIRKA